MSSLTLRFAPKVSVCLACGSSELHPAFSLKLSDMPISWDSCRRCGLTFQNPRIEKDCMGEIYASETYWGKSNASGSSYGGYQGDKVRLKQSQQRLNTIQKITGMTRGELLDIGCASGFFMHVCKQQGFNVIGLDPSPQMAKWAEELYGVKVLCSTLEEIELPAAKYDLVTLWGTDSHFYDPAAGFRKIAGALKPGGYLAMNYQDFSHWIRRIFPGIKKSWNAIYNLTPQALRVIFDAAGLEMIQVLPEWQWTSLSHILRTLKYPGTMPWDMTMYVPAVSYRIVIARKPGR